MTREGIPGTVERVEDGPVAGAEQYIVVLDGGMGGGEYGPSELSAIGEQPGNFEPRGLPRTIAMASGDQCPVCGSTETEETVAGLLCHACGYPEGTTAALEMKYREWGQEGNKTHITYEEKGTVPTSWLANMVGVSGERPGEHRNKQGQEWEDFKADIAANGITNPIFITVDWGQDPKISEGNHRRDAAVELGLPEVPVTVRYFGKADSQGTLEQRFSSLRSVAMAVTLPQQGVPEPGREASVEADLKLATDDYPELGDILVQRPDHQIRVRASLQMTAGMRLVDAREVSTALRRAGFSASKSEGTRIRGAPHMTSGFECRKFNPLDTPKTYFVVKVTWVNDWAASSRGVADDPVTKAEEMGRALEQVGFVVERPQPGMLYVWRESTLGSKTAGLKPVMYHLTDDVDFKLDPRKQPENNSTLGGDWPYPGIFLGDSPEAWVNGYGYWRPWVVEFQVDPSVAEAEHYLGSGYGGEVFIPGAAFDKLRITRVMPLDGYCREEYGGWGWTEESLGTDYLTGEPLERGSWGTIEGKPPAGPAPDARQMDRAWCSAYKKRVKQHARQASKTADLVEVPPNDPTAGEQEVRRVIEEGSFTHVGLAIKAVDSGRVLLVQRTPYEGDEPDVYGRWEFPGGGIDEDEDPLEAALREFGEETGLTPPKLRLVGAMPSGSYLLVMALVPSEGWTTDARLLDFEVMGLGWFHPDQIENADDLVRAEMDDTEWDMVREAKRRLVAADDTDAKSWVKGDIVVDSNGTRWRVHRPYGSSTAENIYVADENDTDFYPESSRSVRVYNDGTAKYTKDDQPFRKVGGYDEPDYYRGTGLYAEDDELAERDRGSRWEQPVFEETECGFCTGGFAEDGSVCPYCNGRGTVLGSRVAIRTQADGLVDKALDWVADKTDYEPGHNWSYDWCRFRKNSRCFYPKQLDEVATKSAGYAVWVPEDRGFCPRQQWGEQKACPVAEPGPHSGERNAMPDATVSWADGGQRYSSVTAAFGDDEWQEEEHPRHDDGKFAPKTTPPRTKPNSAGDMPADAPAVQDVGLDPHQPTGTGGPLGLGEEPPDDGSPGSKSNPIRTDDVEEAANALAEGRYVELQQPKQVSTLLDELASRIRQAKESGGELNINLCQVSVPGTNLFCIESKGIPRIQMPQLKSTNVTPGSRAATELQPNEKGEYDLQPAFRQMLQERGISVTDETELAANLKATQSELNAGKIAGITDAILDEGIPMEESVFVSSDDYIVDGHHRWASNIAADYVDGDANDIAMPIQRVGMGIIELLAEANRFAQEWGIPQQSVTASLRSCCAECADPMIVFAGLADDGEFGFHVTASWRDVQEKAKRIRSEGGVRVISVSGSYVTAEVRGDTALYQTSIMRFGGSVATWECGCKWAAYSWGRSGRWTKYEGRMCSHALALTYAAQSGEMFGRELQEQPETPSWRNDPTQTVRLPGDQKTTTHPWRIGVIKAHGMRPVYVDPELHLPPASAMAAGFLEQAMEPSEVTASLRRLGVRDPEGFVVVALKGFPFRARIRGVIHTILGLLPDGMFDTSAGAVRGDEIVYPTYDRSLGLSLRDSVASKTAGVLPLDQKCRVCGHEVDVPEGVGGTGSIVICSYCDSMYVYRPSVPAMASLYPELDAVLASPKMASPKMAETFDTTVWDGYSLGPAIVPNTADDPEDFADPLAAPEYMWQPHQHQVLVAMPDGSAYPYDRPWYDPSSDGFWAWFASYTENGRDDRSVTALVIDLDDTKQKAKETEQELGLVDDSLETVTSELHDEPEPALPTTDGEIEDVPVEMLPGHPALAHLMKGVPAQAGGSPQMASDSDIAAMARKVLATKTFTPAEQAQIINEGEGVTAGNLDLLDIAGTHYEALEAALVSSDPADDGALFG